MEKAAELRIPPISSRQSNDIKLFQLGCRTYELNLVDEVTIQAAVQAFGPAPLDLLINCAGRKIGCNLVLRY